MRSYIARKYPILGYMVVGKKLYDSTSLFKVYYRPNCFGGWHYRKTFRTIKQCQSWVCKMNPDLVCE